MHSVRWVVMQVLGVVQYYHTGHITVQVKSVVLRLSSG